MEDKVHSTILLVEDDAIIALSEKMILERYGYQVIVTFTGEDAVNIAENESEINLILMDIDLGKGIDGTIAAQRILEKKDVPIVFMSSHTEKEIVDKTDKITSYGYIVKNSGETVLMASIKMAFRLFQSKMNEIQKEKILQESEFFFKESQRVANIGSYKTDFISGYWKSSEVLNNIFGIEKDYNRSIQGWVDIIHPDERERMVKYLNEFVIEKQQPFDMEYKIVRMSDNAERWVHGLGAVKFDDSGKIVSMIGTIQDITERKETELLLQKSETMMRYILDTIPQSVFWKDNKSIYLGCNKTFTKTAGISNPADIIGKTDFDLPWPRSEAEAYRADDSYVIWNKKAKYHIIEEALTADGDRITVDTTKLPLLDENGAVYGVLGVYEDITDRKKAEDSIQNLLQEKTLLLKEVHHRIKNNIISIENQLTLQSGSMLNHECQIILLDAISRVKSMRVLYDILLTTEDYQHISCHDYFENLINTIISIYPDAGNITIKKHISDFTINSNILSSLGIIVNELITNAIKYAFNNKSQGVLEIAISNIGTKVSIRIADNGTGLPQVFSDLKKGFGYMLIDMLVKQLHGKYSITGDNGTRCSIECEIP